jgi:hypothetical protein
MPNHYPALKSPFFVVASGRKSELGMAARYTKGWLYGLNGTRYRYLYKFLWRRCNYCRLKRWPRLVYCKQTAGRRAGYTGRGKKTWWIRSLVIDYFIWRQRQWARGLTRLQHYAPPRSTDPLFQGRRLDTEPEKPKGDCRCPRRWPGYNNLVEKVPL